MSSLGIVTGLLKHCWKPPHKNLLNWVSSLYIFPNQCNSVKMLISSWQQIFHKGRKNCENARSLVDSLASEPGLKSQGVGGGKRLSKVLTFIFLHRQHAWKIVYLVTDQKALSYIVHLSNLIWDLQHCSFLLPLFFEMLQWNEAWFIRARLPEDLTMQTASSAAYYHCSRLTQIHSDTEHSLQALDTVICPLQGTTGRKTRENTGFP